MTSREHWVKEDHGAGSQIKLGSPHSRLEPDQLRHVEALIRHYDLEYGSPRTLDVVRENLSDIAAVLVDPLQASMRNVDSEAFLRGLRIATDKGGAALVFDETLSGFRCAPSETEGLRPVRADLTILGNSSTGGLPIGVLAGARKFLDAIDGGPRTFADASTSEVLVTEISDPMGVHPLVFAAARATLTAIRAAGKSLPLVLAAKAKRFVDGLTPWLARCRRPISFRVFGPMVFIDFSEAFLFRELLFVELATRGVLAALDFPILFSVAHTDSDIDLVVDHFKSSLSALVELSS